MRLACMFAFVVLLCFPASTQDANYFQKTTWGLQLDAMPTRLGAGYAEGITFQHQRHKIQLSLLLVKTDANHAVLSLWGPYFNYKYFAFRPKKYFNFYLYTSVSGGKNQSQQSISRLHPDPPMGPEVQTGTHFRQVSTLQWMAGAGLEVNIFRRFYFDLAIAIGPMRTKWEEFDFYLDLRTLQSETLNAFNNDHVVFSGEARMGAGFRF